jgi:carboxymethylenebutenolidase
MSEQNLQDHSKSLFPAPEPAPRRGFLVNTITAGLAFAVSPATAQQITTGAEGLTAGMVKIPAAGGEMPAYRAMPAKGKDFPVVLVVHEIFGVHEYIQDVCRRFAKLGHLAVAPNLYARQGSVDNLQDFNEIRKVVGQVPDSQVMADLDATMSWAGRNSGNINKLGITGFCWGGRIVWLYAAHQAKLKAGVAWYGGLVSKQPTELQPKAPIDLVPELKAPVLGLYGAADQGIPVATVDQMKEALKKDGKKGDIIVYPDGPHGFHADYRPSYRKEMAEDGWKRLLAWFKEYGAA